MILNVLFSDFTTVERYLALQNKFANYDVSRQGMEEPQYEQFILGDFTITTQSVDENHNPDVTEISFYDFINPQINTLARTFIGKINTKIDSQFLHNVPEREHFIQYTLDELFVIGERVSSADYFNSTIQDELLLQLNMVIDFLSNYNSDKEYKIEKKLQFNLNKTDLLLLMHLFRLKGHLNCPYDAQLGFLIEKTFQYYNEETKSYDNIIKAGKVINDIKNGSRPVNKAIDRLKSILQDDSFYNL
ncbi:hypothetical protein [Flavobacterium sp. GT3R68]|uniref:hypothetical protein n=1 Tax=Flavobacterium sp. GT3R68 TaxID=2594437 RepID=UPI000F88EE79|nr:hypothetical protein [Flavobacterium sp. GT3R68]RTY96043.1 hypothetical protein EKL32_05200 [Flavobacterium sp. GSN2]TRW93816.1 hypothetical protein FNW07_02590 [Flavobacterium sp. GT3R68]